MLYIIVIIYLSNDLSNIYHWHFIKFYIFTCIKYNTIHHNSFQFQYSNDHIMLFNMLDIIVIYLSNDLSNIYHWYFMKFYHKYNIFGEFTVHVLNNNIQYILIFLNFITNDHISFIMLDIIVIYLSNDLSNIYHWHFIKFYH